MPVDKFDGQPKYTELPCKLAGLVIEVNGGLPTIVSLETLEIYGDAILATVQGADKRLQIEVSAAGGRIRNIGWASRFSMT